MRTVLFIVPTLRGGGAERVIVTLLRHLDPARFRMVLGVEGRSRDMKKRLSSMKAAFRYQRDSLKRAEVSHKEMELREGHDVKRIDLSRENLKKSRLHIMREQRSIEELEWEFKQVLTPRSGQQGAPGILAHAQPDLHVLGASSESLR